MRYVRTIIVEKLRHVLRGEYRYILLTTGAYYAASLLPFSSNKLLAAATVLLLIMHAIRFRNIHVALLITYLTSVIMHVGKTYEIELLPQILVRGYTYRPGLVEYVIITPSDIIAFFMGLAVIRTVRLEYRRLTVPVYTVILAVFTLVIWISALAAQSTGFVYWNAAQISVWVVLALNIACMGSNKQWALRLVMSVLFSAVLFESLLVFAQTFRNNFVGTGAELVGYVIGDGLDDNQYLFRPLGTFPHANDMAQFMITLLPIAVAWTYVQEKKRTRYAGLLIIISAMVSIILSQSRSAWIVMFMTLIPLLYLFEKHFRKTIVVSKRVIRTLALSGVLALFPIGMILYERISVFQFSLETRSNWSTRWIMMTEWLNIIMRHPVFGTGPGISIVEAAQANRDLIYLFPTYVHNVYILIASESGIVAAALFLLFFIVTLKNAVYNAKRGETKASGLMTWGVVFGIAAALINYSVQLPTGIPLVISLAALYADS